MFGNNRRDTACGSGDGNSRRTSRRTSPDPCLLMVFREQILVFAQPGALPAPVLDDLLTKVRELDMDDVRRQIGEEKAS